MSRHCPEVNIPVPVKITIKRYDKDPTTFQGPVVVVLTCQLDGHDHYPLTPHVGYQESVGRWSWESEPGGQVYGLEQRK